MDQQNNQTPGNGTAFVPAICTQCGAHLEVDPTQEAAVCQYCGTPFIVQKAINNYNIQNAKIEHADTVNINMKSTADSFFGFLGRQMSESREVRREERREAREMEKKVVGTFFKVFGIVAVVMVLVWVLATVFGWFPDADAANDAPAAEQISGRVEERDYTVYLKNPDDTLTNKYPLFFVDGVYDLPYVELRDWAEMLYFLNTEYGEDPGYELDISKDGEVITLTRENGYTLDFDFENGRMVFSDYDAFVHKSVDSTLIDLVSEPGIDAEGNPQLILRDRQASFDRYGDVLTVDLKAYGIDMVVEDGTYYVPLQTMNDFTLQPMLISLLFNGEALFLANDGALFDYKARDYSELASIYYAADTGERSEELAEYSYNELCLVLDTFYGLKEQHDIESFRRLFWQIGLDEALSGTNAVDADLALKAVIDYYLDDLHSVFNEFSYLSGINPIESSTGYSNRTLMRHSDEYLTARDQFYTDYVPGYEEVGNTAYITFDEFTSNYYAPAFYNAKESGEYPEDTIGLVIYAHSQITRENSPIENVVLDLSNNTGGSVDAAIFLLGWMLGDAPFSVKNMATGAMSTAVYRSDTNLDRVFDEKDTVADKNLYCLISPVSFSCGNLVPAALKASQKVALLGRTSGGGSCAVQPLSTAYGTVFQISSCWRFSFLKNGSFYDIDQGVEPDYYINDLAHYYDRAALTDYINSLT